MTQLIPQLLRQVPFFQQLSDDVLQDLADIGKVQQWEAGLRVFSAGDLPDCLYLILNGRVEIRKATPSGQNVTLATVGKGHFFGEMALIDGGRRTASAQTLVPCELFVISRDKFTELLSQCPHLIPRVCASIVSKLRNVNEQFLIEVCDKQRLQAEIVQERYRSISQIAASANEASTTDQAMQTVISELCRYIRWPIGHVYVMDEEVKGSLFSSGIWHLQEPDRFSQFRKISEMSPLSEGVGIPGRVLQKHKPVWVEDIARETDCPRLPDAIQCGIKSGFAFPVIVGGDVIAVLEFFSTEHHEIDRMLLEATDQVSTQLGRSIERKRLG
jgi:CRP-like cAMP-binding protein